MHIARIRAHRGQPEGALPAAGRSSAAFQRSSVLGERRWRTCGVPPAYRRGDAGSRPGADRRVSTRWSSSGGSADAHHRRGVTCADRTDHAFLIPRVSYCISVRPWRRTIRHSNVAANLSAGLNLCQSMLDRQPRLTGKPHSSRSIHKVNQDRRLRGPPGWRAPQGDAHQHRWGRRRRSPAGPRRRYAGRGRWLSSHLAAGAEEISPRSGRDGRRSPGRCAGG
jgi:hypothetical protein